MAKVTADSSEEMSESAENVSSAEPSTSQESEKCGNQILESPKPLAFTIDFGDRKTVDTSRYKNIFEKYQNRHRRGKSLSKIESPNETKTQPVNHKPPLSVNFPRKSDYNSEGYFSSDQEDKTDPTFLRKLKNLKLKSGPMSVVKQRSQKSDLTLPLQNTTQQRLNEKTKQRNFDLSQITSPESDLKDISSPEFDLLTPSDPTPSTMRSIIESRNSVALKSPSPATSKSILQEMKAYSSTDSYSNSSKSVSRRLGSQRNCSSLDTPSCEIPTPDSDKSILSPDFDNPSPVKDRNIYANVESCDVDQKSDTVSETGTYTIDADNYTEEQKMRMSIDRDFNISTDISTAQMTQSFVESTLQFVDDVSVESGELTPNNLNEMHLKNIKKCMNRRASHANLSKSVVEINYQSENNTQNTKLSVGKVVTLDSSSESHDPHITGSNANLVKENVILNNIDTTRRNEKNTNKVLFASKKQWNSEDSESADQGSFTSITTSGVFSREHSSTGSVHAVSNKLSNSSSVELSPERKLSRKGSLTKTDIFYDNNITVVKEGNRITYGSKSNVNDTSQGIIGSCSKKPPISPTKIPSPIHSLSRPRSRASLDLSDSSTETDYYLKHTQNVITSLQARLNLEQGKKLDQRKIAQNIIKNQTKHIRHNSFDSKSTNLTVNKLENFQNKNFQPNIDQTFPSQQNQYSMQRNLLTSSAGTNTKSPTHRIHNSPNNSPVRRSSSFSVKHVPSNQLCSEPEFQQNYISSPRIQKESNLARNSPNLNRTDYLQHSPNSSSAKQHINLYRRASTESPDRHFDNRYSASNDVRLNRNQFADTDSSSDDDFANNVFVKQKEVNITNTRHNRAFSLRRARLEIDTPISKCPNTPEMRRKFMSPANCSDSAKRNAAARGASGDHKKGPEIQSRYLNIIKNSTPKPVLKNVSNKSNDITPKGNMSRTSNVKIGGTVTKNPVMARTDSGRFSMRAPKQKTSTPTQKSNSKKGNRSNSTLSSREVEFQNWKRRKSYDPMKAAAEGKRKAELNRKLAQCNTSNTMTQSYTEASQDCDSSPSHSSSVHRSQSFHGTAGLDNYISSEDELTLSADECEGETLSPPIPSPDMSVLSSPTNRQAWFHESKRY